MSETNNTSSRSPLGRFASGFIVGGFSGFLAVLLCDQQLVSALIGGFVFAILIGGACALLGKRFSELVIELITRFPG